MDVFQAHIEQLQDVAELFDQYRVFYQSAADLDAAKRFIQERFQKGDSAIFVASDAGNLVGFTQLYPSFSSVSMKRIWILNDLFVTEAYRRKGVATLLMEKAEDFARETGAIRIALATQAANLAAQSLYESRGYTLDEWFYHYALRL